uniref:efflux RND transporter periplasmic adaptor subunit n=1 Tax=Thaumasiovibrio occultus TaxID=1891184 RepID=UPI000B350804|nr:efflux RND transporter periplasmic adaptor subunit [Thaumasiovibrio occultus]
MLIGVSAVIGGLGYYKYVEITSAIEMAASFPEHYEVVDATEVEISEHTPTVSVLGSARSPLHTELFTELSGKVALVGTPAGGSASKGDVLFQLNIAEEQARIKSARARERHARSVFNRYKQLLASNAISREKYDQAYADLIVIQSEIESLQAVIAKKTVTAPFDGIMGLHDLKQGDYVSANQLITNFVGNSDKIWIEFSVPQFYPELAINASVRVRNIDALGASSYQVAHIIAKDTQISDTTRSLKYRAEIDRNLAHYTPNMPLELLIPISDNHTVYQVPAVAVNQDMYGAYVMKLAANENESGTYRAHRLPVQVMAEVNGNKLITQGVEAGELIAAAGAFKLYEGLLVRVRNTQTSPALIAATGE